MVPVGRHSCSTRSVVLRRFGRLAVVRLLLDARADMLVVNAEGTSAIAIAQLGKGADARPSRV